MGVADISRFTLNSEIVRKGIANNGVRIFKAAMQDKQSNGDIISWLWNLNRFVGSIIQGAAKVLGLTFTALWGLFVATTQYIWNFNWNITDKEIDNQIQSAWNAIGGILGGTVGNALGYFACGILPSAYIFTLNEALAIYVLENVAEEMAEEIIGNLNILIRYTFMSSVQSLLLWSFKSIRALIKSNTGAVQAIFGSQAAALVKAWGEPNSKPWSFAKAVDDKVESISNTFVRNFVEEFLEEAWEGCVEAGYVVAGSIDNWHAQQKLAAERGLILGQQKYVEIQPDRKNERERIILAGPEQALKPTIVQTLTNYQLMENKDIGTMVGQPVDDYLRARPQSIRLVITFYSVLSPPWKAPQKERLVRATYAIPDVKASKCDWETIKLACGGQNGYMWGRFRATGELSNGRQMQVFGATPDEAEDRLKALVALSEAKLVKKPSISEDRSEDSAGKYLKQETRIYPAYFTIMNQYKVAGARGSAIPLSDGMYNRRSDRIDLWSEKEPPFTKELITDLLKKPGAEQEQ